MTSCTFETLFRRAALIEIDMHDTVDLVLLLVWKSQHATVNPHCLVVVHACMGQVSKNRSPHVTVDRARIKWGCCTDTTSRPKHVLCAQITMAGARPLEVTLALVKPTVCTYVPDIVHAVRRIQTHPELNILRTRPIAWTKEDAAAFYAEHKGKFYYDRLVLGMSSGRSLALALSGPGAIQTWRRLIGPTKAYRTKWEAPDTLRAQLGLGDTRNGFHGSDSTKNALQELGFVFPEWNAASWLSTARDALRAGGPSPEPQHL